MPTKNRDSYAIDVGRRLADARRAAVPRINQKDAAEYLSKRLNKRVSHTTISNYESGSRLPTPPIVDVLCQFYGTLPAAYVLGILTIREAHLLQKYKLASEEKKREFDRLTDAQSTDSQSNRLAVEALLKKY
ncbi:helix-turn-helix domain-containing protein [Xylella fastidiosa]|uniref:helix-turn-helix domain-containing protein n=1 Tax=Xylella fastidiosa TaxID=2371 RepID=UPI000765E999|nr:helix-turn-helix transcriptional regulator [Xylella fastidiosa]KXB19392.1 hypothetical protein ADT30_09575 [Xylella fastidiosa]